MLSVLSRLLRPQPTFGVADIIEAYEAGRTAERAASERVRQVKADLGALIAAGPQPTGLRLIVDNGR